MQRSCVVCAALWMEVELASGKFFFLNYACPIAWCKSSKQHVRTNAENIFHSDLYQMVFLLWRTLSTFQEFPVQGRQTNSSFVSVEEMKNCTFVYVYLTVVNVLFEHTPHFTVWGSYMCKEMMNKSRYCTLYCRAAAENYYTHFQLPLNWF